MDKVKELFKELGYTEKEIEKIVNARGIAGLKSETLIKKLKRTIAFGVQ